MRTVLLSTAIGLLIVSGATAGDGCAPPACDPAAVQTCGTPDCCGGCGTKARCAKKVCQVVCDVKKVKKVVWTVECEEFCAPLPNCDRCRNGCGCGAGGQACCETACSSCESCCGKSCCDPCASLRNRNYVPPKCGKVRCRKKLVKKEITCEIPVYKCVVVYACPSCCDPRGCCEEGAPVAEEAEPEEEAPVAPAPREAKLPPVPLPPVASRPYLEALTIRP